MIGDMATVFVSGATGFIASHLVEQLLDAGHRVRGSVRSLKDPAKVAHLRALAGADDRLELVEADLLAPDAFGGRLDGCDVVMHTASPYRLDVRDPQRDLVDPAVQGTRAMLEAAFATPGIRRVVLTSSIAAITDQPDRGRVYDETDWNTTSSLQRNPYHYSKTLAERAAWQFVEERRPTWDLVVINPSVVIGPSMTSALNTSNGIIAALLNGTYPVIFDLTWAMVDVRDVAAAHVRAMETAAAAGRYVCSADSIPARRVVTLLRENGYDAYRLPSIGFDNPVGTWLAKLASWTQPKGIGQYLRTHVGAPLRFDNTKIRRELGLEFRPIEPTILETAADLERWGHLRGRRGGTNDPLR